MIRKSTSFLFWQCKFRKYIWTFVTYESRKCVFAKSYVWVWSCKTVHAFQMLKTTLIIKRIYNDKHKSVILPHAAFFHWHKLCCMNFSRYYQRVEILYLHMYMYIERSKHFWSWIWISRNDSFLSALRFFEWVVKRVFVILPNCVIIVSMTSFLGS